MAISLPSIDITDFALPVRARTERPTAPLRLDARAIAGALLFLDVLFSMVFQTFFQSQTRGFLGLNPPLMTLDVFIAISLLRGQSHWINLARGRLVLGGLLLLAMYCRNTDWNDGMLVIVTSLTVLVLLLGRPSNVRVMGSIATFMSVVAIHVAQLYVRHS